MCPADAGCPSCPETMTLSEDRSQCIQATCTAGQDVTAAGTCVPKMDADQYDSTNAIEQLAENKEVSPKVVVKRCDQDGGEDCSGENRCCGPANQAGDSTDVLHFCRDISDEGFATFTELDKTWENF